MSELFSTYHDVLDISFLAQLDPPNVIHTCLVIALYLSPIKVVLCLRRALIIRSIPSFFPGAASSTRLEMR